MMGCSAWNRRKNRQDQTSLEHSMRSRGAADQMAVLHWRLLMGAPRWKVGHSEPVDFGKLSFCWKLAALGRVTAITVELYKIP